MIQVTYLSRISCRDNVVINSSNAKKLEQVYIELGGGENLAMVAGNVKDKSTGEKLGWAGR